MKSGISIKIMWGLAALFFLLPASKSRGAYCTAYGINCSEYISGVVFETINNTGTGCNNGYTDYTSLSTTISVGQSYLITITNGGPFSGDQCGIWIDWNQDEDFDDEDEEITASGGPGTFTATISAPAHAAAGDTRLRVRITYTGILIPCGNTTYGEVEDYTINVKPKYSGGGTGEPNNPYLIATPDDLNSIGLDPCDWDKHFKMIADINMVDITGTQFNIIGPNSSQPFIGAFDGNGHSIFNFSYKDTSKDYVGLFGYINDPCAVIKNLGLVDPNVDGHDVVGALVGGLNKGTLLTCFVLEGSVKGRDEVGGMVSYVGMDASLTDCHITGDVAASNMHVGGLVSTNFGQISYCSASCYVHGAWAHLGGLVYVNLGHIRCCYAEGICEGGSYVGGFVSNNEGTIEDSYSKTNTSGSDIVGGFAYSAQISHRCYSAGQVSAEGRAGGFAWITYDTTSSCFWDTDIAVDVNNTWLGNDPNIIGLTTAEMQQRSTFTDAGWDFVSETVNGANDIWDICEGTNYPKFVWQILPADLICPDGVDFIDYSVLANQWKLEKIEQDYNSDGRVNFNDWALLVDDWDGQSYAEPASFIDRWLALSTGRADISPPGGDDSVDWQDLMVFAQHWLEGI